ncbi:chromosome partition protein MukE [Shigella flexneri]
MVNNRSTGSDVDRQKLQEKVRSSLNRLRRLGMVWFLGHDSSKFRITNRFPLGADVRSGDDPREAQRRLIRDGEAMAVENRLQLNDEPEENQPHSGEKNNDSTR